MLQRLRYVLRGQAERAGAVLIDHELQVGRLLVPVELRIPDVRVLRAPRRAPGRRSRAPLGVRADHAELDRKADRRAEIEPVDAHARFGQRAVVDRLLQPRLDPLARLDVLGDDDDLGKGLVRQLRVEPEPEARRALADIGGVGRDVLSSFSSASAFFTDFSVTPNAVPSGSRSCRNSSGRSDSGKNCCCTWPKPTIDEREDADRRQPPP